MTKLKVSGVEIDYDELARAMEYERLRRYRIEEAKHIDDMKAYHKHFQFYARQSFWNELPYIIGGGLGLFGASLISGHYYGEQGMWLVIAAGVFAVLGFLFFNGGLDNYDYIQKKTVEAMEREGR